MTFLVINVGSSRALSLAWLPRCATPVPVASDERGHGKSTSKTAAWTLWRVPHKSGLTCQSLTTSHYLCDKLAGVLAHEDVSPNGLTM